MTTYISNAILMTMGNNTIKPQLCKELVVVWREVWGDREWERVRALPLGADVPLPLGSVWLSSNFKLSFLSRKQMFLLSFSNFRVYFQDKCLFSHRIQFTFFKTFFSVVQMILVYCRKVIDSRVGKKAKKKKIINLTTWSDFMGGAVVKTPCFTAEGSGSFPSRELRSCLPQGMARKQNRNPPNQ